MSCILSIYGHSISNLWAPYCQTDPFCQCQWHHPFFWHKQQVSWNRHGKYGHFYMAMFKLLELEKNNCMNYMTTIFLEIKTRFKLKCLSTCWRRALNCLAWTSRQVCPSFIHEFSSWNGPIRFSVFCLRSRHGVHENPTEGNRYKMAPPLTSWNPHEVYVYIICPINPYKFHQVLKWLRWGGSARWSPPFFRCRFSYPCWAWRIWGLTLWRQWVFVEVEVVVLWYVYNYIYIYICIYIYLHTYY